MLVLDQVLGDAYGAAFAKAETHELLAEIESNTLGASHAEVGGWLRPRAFSGQSWCRLLA